MKRIAFPLLLLCLIAAAPALAADNKAVLGSWSCTSASPGGGEGEMAWTLDVREVEGKLVGTAGNEGGSVDLIDPKFENDTLSFKVALDSGTYALQLKIKGNTLEGAWTGDGGQKGAVKGTKKS